MINTEQTKTTKKTPPITLILDQEKNNSLSYTRSEIIIGRSAHCDLLIEDETVSSRHGQISYRHNQWWYEDLGSSNGSLINGLDVATPIVLTEGDQLRLGKITIDISFV